ncbi:hypothetical protein FOB72_26715 [Cupriavidus pauculus]|uniref:Uncharacterized protein n=1 Tax=Cupriavidus pauculus TaxID=82633 RepID=A0A5P2HE13_9BURK|nr:hypothetical protein FOB72_26715 [Cupriavidus pauculus]
MRHPPARMTARRRSYRLAGPPPSVQDLLSPPLLPFPHAPRHPSPFCAASSRVLAAHASRMRPAK